MDTKQRADLVRQIRFESKQARGRAPRPQLTPQEERDNNLVSQSRRSLRSRRPGAAYAERERLRTIREGGTRGMGDNARDHLMRNANTRFQSRTGFSGPNGVEVTLTPRERVNRVGVASRRRHVSPGLVPNGPNEEFRRGTERHRRRRRLERMGIPSGAASRIAGTSR